MRERRGGSVQGDLMFPTMNLSVTLHISIMKLYMNIYVLAVYSSRVQEKKKEKAARRQCENPEQVLSSSAAALLRFHVLLLQRENARENP